MTGGLPTRSRSCPMYCGRLEKRSGGEMLIEILLVAASMTSLTSKSGAVRVRKRFTKSSAIEDGFDVPMKTLLTFVPPEFATSSESVENDARANPQGAQAPQRPGPDA